MTDSALDLSHLSRSRIPAGDGIDWAAVAAHPLAADAARALRYMQDTESHTIIYLRELLATRAIDDPEVADFLACWFYEESAHGRAIRTFLGLAGYPTAPRAHSVEPLRARLQAAGIVAASALWPRFVAVHMTWGAINELTAVAAYRRLARVADHPVLDVLLGDITRDESRHFGFYYAQAERRLNESPAARRVTRALVERFWAPVGSGVQPPAETRFIGAYLFTGDEGRAAARTVDRTIRRLPGFDDAPLVEAWVERHATGGHSEHEPARAMAGCPELDA